MQRCSPKNGNAGFTMIEMLVVIAIAVILLALGLPSLLNMIAGSRIDGATRQVMYEIRAVQSLAVTRGGDFGFHWGGDPLVGLPLTQYRVETDPSGACAAPPAGWPAAADTTATNPNVIRDWFDLSVEYPGVVIQSVEDANTTVIGGVMFNSRGASVNTCVPVTFPLTITIADTSGATRTIQVQRAGRVSII
ncbi:MAG: Tfp pilus assembly protein FimT/FimU [Candidatus Methylomirabilales bacterium]